MNTDDVWVWVVETVGSYGRFARLEAVCDDAEVAKAYAQELSDKAIKPGSSALVWDNAGADENGVVDMEVAESPFVSGLTYRVMRVPLLKEVTR